MRRRAVSKAALAEYRRARAALLRKLSRSRAAGYDVSGVEIPAIPKRVTWGSARRLRKLSAKISVQKKTGKITRALPVFETKLLDTFDKMIQDAESYIDDDTNSSLARAKEALVRHRAEEARQEYISHGLNVDTTRRANAEYNLEKTWPMLIEILEGFLYGSDQGYNGDLSQLFWLFTRLCEDPEKPMTEEERKKYAEGTGSWAAEMYYGDDEYV